MKNTLARHLAVLLVVKLLLLTGLWFAFVRGQATHPDASRVTDHLLNATPSPSSSSQETP